MTSDNTKNLSVDICVIGAGSGGLSVAAGASQLGVSVVLVERDRMGGDCLNTGCVPSKALLAAGHAPEVIAGAKKFGISVGTPEIDAPRVRQRVRDVIAAIEPNDSAARFEGMGVTVIGATARFVGPKTIEAGGHTVTARRFIIATGARAALPAISGIDKVPSYTNETIFDLEAIPDHLIIIGGGPIGMEMADAHRGLGSRVSVLEMFSIMPKDDFELVDVVRQAMVKKGIDIRENVRIEGIEASSDGGISITVLAKGGMGKETISGSHLLIATGRRPNVDGLDLDKAGVAYSEKGIEVDKRLRTSNKKIFAMGDVIGGMQFTHVAGYHASIIIKNALFRFPARACHRFVPWVTYTKPELAQVGQTEAEALAGGGPIRVLRWPYAENDRAQTDGKTEGLIKVITDKKGRILGAGIAGEAAGELIGPWILALSGKMKIGAMATMIAPYPTLGEISKRCASSFYTPSLFSEKTRKIVRFLARFG